jgi:hypothetical protein
MIAKLGPHVIRADSEAAMRWAAAAPTVKALDNPAPLTVASNAKVLVFRAYFENQDISQLSPEEAVRIILERLGGFNDPRLYVELLNEVYQYMEWGFKDYVAWTAKAAELLHQAGYKVAGFSFSTGTPKLDTDPGGAAEWLYLKSKGYAGVDAIALHEYWGASGFTEWHALRHRRVHEILGPGHPPFIITECGRDAVEGATGGWRKDGIPPEQYISELLAYDAELAKDDYVLGATVFTAGPTPDWEVFSTDPISDQLVAAGTGGSAPASTPEPPEPSVQPPSPGEPASSASPTPGPTSPYQDWIKYGGSGRLRDYLEHVAAIGGDPTIENALLDGWRPDPGLVLTVDAGAPAMPEPWTAEQVGKLKELGVELAVFGLYNYVQVPVFNEKAPASIDVCLEAGLKVAGYIVDDGKADPGYVVKACRDLVGDRWSELAFVAVDVEMPTRADRVRKFIGLLQGTGTRAVIYTGAWAWKRFLGGTDAFKDIPLWVAVYGVEPGLELVEPFGGWATAVGHQFMGNVSLAGLTVDVSVFDRSWLETGEVADMKVSDAVKSELKIQLDAAWGESEKLRGLAHGDVADRIQVALAVIATRLRTLGLID